MTQRVNEKLKEMCRACSVHSDRPCAWLSLGNEYCSEIMNIQEMLEQTEQENKRLKEEFISIIREDGEFDFEVYARVIDLSYEEYEELKSMLITAIGTMEEIRREHRGDSNE